MLAYKMADSYSSLLPAAREQHGLTSAAASPPFPHSVKETDSNPSSSLPFGRCLVLQGRTGCRRGRRGSLRGAGLPRLGLAGLRLAKGE